jgi:hypothetical protein
MSSTHPRPWRRESLFGPGLRRPLNREQRARFRYLLIAHRRSGRLTPLAELVGNALVRRLGVDGQCDPAHETMAADVGCSSRTVRRSLAALKAVGLVMWQCRVVRDGWRCAQTSNAYLLALSEVRTLPVILAPHCGGQSGRQTQRIEIHPLQQATTAEIQAAQAVLAQRRAVIETRLLNGGER